MAVKELNIDRPIIKGGLEQDIAIHLAKMLALNKGLEKLSIGWRNFLI